jgi:4-hydroxybenzoate polyprenyltransferase
MARWFTFIWERFPPVTYFLLAGGFALSGASIAPGSLDALPLTGVFVAILLLLFELRLMDEVKDYEKDVVAHPGRPLPRGLLSRGEVRRAIQVIFVLQVAFGLALIPCLNAWTGSLFLLSTLYLYLMYKEFFVGRWLNRRPLLYALTHQLIIFPLCFFAVSASQPDSIGTTHTLGYGLAVLGAFFAFEVCRKLDPEAHPVLSTYLKTYGPRRTALLVVGASIVAGLGAALLEMKMILWPVEAALVLGVALVIQQPTRYKLAEVAAVLSLLVHIWGPALDQMVPTHPGLPTALTVETFSVGSGNPAGDYR